MMRGVKTPMIVALGIVAILHLAGTECADIKESDFQNVTTRNAAQLLLKTTVLGNDVIGLGLILQSKTLDIDHGYGEKKYTALQ